MTAAPGATVNGSARDTPLPRPAPIARRTAVLALIVGSVLNLAEALISRMVGQSSSVAGSLEGASAHPTLAAVGLVLGTISVPFLLLALVAMAHLVRPRMPKLGATAMVLGFVGGLGFFGIHAVGVYDLAAIDHPDREAMVALIESAQNSALGLLVVAPFLLGMAGSVLLSSIGHLRTRVVPIWIPVVLLAFLVLDFGGFPVGPVDPHWLFVAASLGLAVLVARMTDRQWWTGRTPGEATP